MTMDGQGFSVSTETERAYRDALGRFGTGLTVVTTMTPDGPVGITANSFSSVSLDPPLVLWSIARSSRRFGFFADASHTAIHVLAADQAPIATAFASNPGAFAEIPWQPGAGGVPLIDGCLSRFECATHATHDGGDHVILVARVLRATTRDGAPLMVFGGDYGRFVPG